ncbi:MAG: type I glutamate--ammonia ligase [Alphaproteobacteria bacterium]|nr:type I glutamate--ammonia ligase [Alphaproteobacteria bacterium]
MAGPKEFLTQLVSSNTQYVDFRFTDLSGAWHHMSMPISAVTENLIQEGIFFDGSSIPGWKAIHESDMILIPDLTRTMIDQFSSQPTTIVFCDVYDPVTRLPYDRDPRSLAKRAQAYLLESGIADNACFGAEPEFFIFDNVSFDSGTATSFYELASDEFPQANGQSVDTSNHGHRPLTKGGYIHVGPKDSLCDLRAEMVTTMAEFGLIMEKHHHEVAPAQHEIGVKYANLLDAADGLQIYKYVVRNVAHSYGKTATFMPKPVYGDNGSGMHVHQSLWLGNNALFAGKEYGGLSETALFYIGGILKHAKALNAFTNPTTNSYKRLIPGFEAPVMLAYSAGNRSAACRIPLTYGDNSKRVEVRFPDPTANSYLAYSAMMMAGLDGIKNRIHPGEAADHDLYEEKEIAKTLPTVCSSLREALMSLEKDSAFLTAGGVFSLDFIKSYCNLKWAEVFALDHAPHPIEFRLYYSS